MGIFDQLVGEIYSPGGYWGSHHHRVDEDPGFR
jgi:hypothetical protein